MSIQVRNEYDSRLVAFQESYTFEECDGLVRPLAVIGEMITLAFAPTAASQAMQAIRLIIETKPDHPIAWGKLETEHASDNWREDWDDLDAFNDTCWSDLMERAHNLHAFAFYGILPVWHLMGSNEDASVDLSEFIDVAKYVRSTVDRLTRFALLFPKEQDYYGLRVIEVTCLAALARLKLDSGEPVTVHELAALTKVTTKRLQNAIYAKSEDSPIAGKDGLFVQVNAQRWLDARDFLPSIWKEYIAGKCWELAHATDDHFDDQKSDDATDEFLFVPEARDGTVFAPKSCLRPGTHKETPHYTIGPKGAEVDFLDYDEALQALSTQKNPRWRRPNENGFFGIVAAERWRRLTRAELASL